ncbi:hypothetical protein Tco_1068233 [Tanacetum coccineum]|uniref:Uncharacterized protein n=1 Tax=Tanacetum coccineum TaxID=301880 RepID=A0ABQ5HGL1_9ASTR
MAQQIILADQLVPKFQGIRRCNNYVVLQSISCSPECKMVGQILLDHLLSYALTATADVLAVYLQQFWKTVRKVPNTEDTLSYSMETPENPFAALVNIVIIESFMHTVCYQGVVDKVSAFYTKFLAQPWQTMFKGKKRKQNARDTSLPQKSLKVTIKQKHVVKGEKDVKSYANKFVASMIHDDVDDSRDRIDPTSHKEHSKVVVDDDDNKKEKKYEKEGDEMGSWETRTEKMQTTAFR